jgi:hypothetical protein
MPAAEYLAAQLFSPFLVGRSNSGPADGTSRQDGESIPRLSVQKAILQVGQHISPVPSPGRLRRRQRGTASLVSVLITVGRVPHRGRRATPCHFIPSQRPYHPLAGVAADAG